MLKTGTEIYPYVIEHALSQGKGGMAQIYIVHEKGKRERLALKICTEPNPQYEEALRSEVEILTKINTPESHPNIIKILPIPISSKYPLPMARAIDLAGKPWFYVMEYLEGQPLSAYARGSKGLPEKVALVIILKISSALNQIHSHSFFHLDVKTENIVMRFPMKTGNKIEPVLIDFGIASHGKEIQKTSGSLAFMAPERIREIQQGTQQESFSFYKELEKIDVYGLGISLFEMMTGQLPFKGITKQGLTTAVLSHNVIRPKEIRSNISDFTDNLILAMIDKYPENRPTTIEIIDQISNLNLNDLLELNVPTRKAKNY